MPGPRDARDAAVLRAAGPGEQRVDERARRWPGRRMDDEPGGLVDDQQVVVLVDHLERDVRRRARGPAATGWRDVERSSRPGRRRSRSPGAASPSAVRRPRR